MPPQGASPQVIPLFPCRLNNPGEFLLIPCQRVLRPDSMLCSLRLSSAGRGGAVRFPFSSLRVPRVRSANAKDADCYLLAPPSVFPDRQPVEYFCLTVRSGFVLRYYLRSVPFRGALKETYNRLKGWISWHIPLSTKQIAAVAKLASTPAPMALWKS